jgi:hypothetical protein
MHVNRIHEKPSRPPKGLLNGVSQGLVISLSMVMILMAGWLAVTLMFSQVAKTPAEGDTDATTTIRAVDPTDGTAVSGAPENMDNSAALPPRVAWPVTPSVSPATRDIGRSPWPAASAAPDAK